MGQIVEGRAVGIEGDAADLQPRQIDDAVEAAGVGLLVDEQQIDHRQHGQRDDGDIDPGDPGPEHEGPEEQRHHHRNQNTGQVSAWATICSGLPRGTLPHRPPGAGSVRVSGG
jgi:hypothetical protein